MEVAEEVFSEGDHGFALVHGVCGEGKRRKLGSWVPVRGLREGCPSSLGMSIVSNFRKIERTSYPPFQDYKNTLWKRKSASDQNIHMRDILIFPAVSFVIFFF